MDLGLTELDGIGSDRGGLGWVELDLTELDRLGLQSRIDLDY